MSQYVDSHKRNPSYDSEHSDSWQEKTYLGSLMVSDCLDWLLCCSYFTEIRLLRLMYVYAKKKIATEGWSVSDDGDITIQGLKTDYFLDK